MRTAVITVCHGRHDHLRRQRDALARAVTDTERHVIVAIDDPAIPGVAAEEPGIPTDIVPVPTTHLGLPLATARNTGAHRALDTGVDLLVFLDVDCIPGPQLVERYREVATAEPEDVVLCGPVTYLPPAPPEGYPIDDLAALTDPHPARPAPADGSVLGSEDFTLFWSLSFAMRAGTWRRVGGFCEDYVGYGGEDTDFGQLARAAGVGMTWIGGAHAYHQHHPVSDPPVDHVADIVRNAGLFYRRWGWWPMRGWLDAFVERGLVIPAGGEFHLGTTTPARAAVAQPP